MKMTPGMHKGLLWRHYTFHFILICQKIILLKKNHAPCKCVFDKTYKWTLYIAISINVLQEVNSGGLLRISRNLHWFNKIYSHANRFYSSDLVCPQVQCNLSMSCKQVTQLLSTHSPLPWYCTLIIKINHVLFSESPGFTGETVATVWMIV